MNTQAKPDLVSLTARDVYCAAFAEDENHLEIDRLRTMTRLDWLRANEGDYRQHYATAINRISEYVLDFVWDAWAIGIDGDTLDQIAESFIDSIVYEGKLSPNPIDHILAHIEIAQVPHWN